jgi:hypothetical protein
VLRVDVGTLVSKDVEQAPKRVASAAKALDSPDEAFGSSCSHLSSSLLPP